MQFIQMEKSKINIASYCFVNDRVINMLKTNDLNLLVHEFIMKRELEFAFVFGGNCSGEYDFGLIYLSE